LALYPYKPIRFGISLDPGDNARSKPIGEQRASLGNTKLFTHTWAWGDREWPRLVVVIIAYGDQMT
jgi:hypothetical protein